MGNFYVNQTLKCDDQAAVASALRDYQAFIFPPQNGSIVVCERLSDEQVVVWAHELASQLSATLHCAVLTVLNHDDDILYYSLHRNGEMIDQYESMPGYFEDSSELQPPSGGNAATLCEAFGSSNVAEVQAALHDVDDRFLFAVHRHQALAKALGVPDCAAGFGYAYLARGERPKGVVGEILEVRSASAYKDISFP